MSIDVADQIRSYYEYIESGEAEIAFDDLEAPRVLSPTPPVRAISRSRGWLAAAASAAVVLLLIGGVGWLSQQEQDNVVDEPTTTVVEQPTTTVVDSPTTTVAAAVEQPTTTLPAPRPVVLRDLTGKQIAVEVVSEELAVSPLGDIEWTVIDLAMMPSPSGPYITTPHGLAVIDNANTQLWLSETGTDWRIAPWPVPGEVTRIESIDGGYLLESLEDWPWPTRPRYRPVQLWESADFVTWTPYQLPDGVLPAVSGVGVNRWAEQDQAATAAGVSFTAWDRSFGIAWEEILFLVDGGVPEPPPDVPRRQFLIRARSVGSEIVEVASYDHEGNAFDRVNPVEVLAQIELSMTGTSEDWVAELKDAVTGTPIGSISGSLPGLSLVQIRSALIDGRQERVYVGGQVDGPVLVQPDWIDLARASDDAPVLAAIADTLFAYIRIGSTGIVGDNQIWRSTDGLTWENVGAAPWPSNAEIRGGISVHNGVAVLHLVDAEENATWTALRSEDGVTWKQPTRPPPPITCCNGVTTSSGWISNTLDFTSTEANFWMSSDGSIWEKVNTQGLPPVDPTRGWPTLPADSDHSAAYWVYYPTEQGLVVGRIFQSPS